MSSARSARQLVPVPFRVSNFQVSRFNARSCIAAFQTPSASASASDDSLGAAGACGLYGLGNGRAEAAARQCGDALRARAGHVRGAQVAPQTPARAQPPAAARRRVPGALADRRRRAHAAAGRRDRAAAAAAAGAESWCGRHGSRARLRVRDAHAHVRAPPARPAAAPAAALPPGQPQPWPLAGVRVGRVESRVHCQRPRASVRDADAAAAAPAAEGGAAALGCESEEGRPAPSADAPGAARVARGRSLRE